MKKVEIKLGKRVEKEMVTNALVQECFQQPKYETQWFTTEHLVQVKLHLDTVISKSEWLDKQHIRDVQILDKAIKNLLDYDNEKLRKILNSVDADRTHYGIVVGKIMERLNIEGENTMEEFYKYEIKAYTAYQLVSTLVELNIIHLRSEFKFEVNEHTGIPEAKQIQYISFGKPKETNEMYVKGISLEPGIVNQKRYQVKSGGKSRKLGKAEKEILSLASSFPLRFVDIELEELELYMKSSPWYMKVLKGEIENFDKLIADDLVENALRKYSRLKTLDKFFLQMWLDYRTRLYYDLVQMGFSPHGKSFETYLFEAAEPYRIQEIEEYQYSAVVLVEGRMAHHVAVEKFEANPEYYLNALRTKPECLAEMLTTNSTEKEIKAYVSAMGDHLYGRRLADAIDSYYNGTETHFLLGEDATNGGLQHGGLAFHSKNMMEGGNVGGLPDQVDSHDNLRQLLDLSERQAAKDIHQPLLHGSAMKTIAEVMEKSVREAEELLQTAYGEEVFNIKTIADWGVAYGTNHNTSLMWKTRDGLFAQSIAYVEAVPLKLKALTTNNKQGYSQLLIHKDMPMLRARNGENVYGSRRKQDKTLLGGSVKNRGLYANITHSIDATGLRNVIRAMHKLGKGGLWKHDNFLVPGGMKTVRAAYKEALIEEFKLNHYEAALSQIIDAYTGAKPPMPQLSIGEATEDMVINSHYYLAP
jgi:hypothetical protein